MLSAGTVYELPDPYVRPKNKLKWHICVCPDRKLFLRINSKPLWPPWHMLEAANNVFLEHDSYVELTQLHFFGDAHQGRVVGQLTSSEARELARIAGFAPTLPQEHKDLVQEHLGSP